MNGRKWLRLWACKNRITESSSGKTMLIAAGSRLGIVFEQMPNTFQHEFLGIKTHCVAWTTRTLGKLVQDPKGSSIGDEKMEPPSTHRVRFHPVEEPAMTVLDQSLAKSVAAGMYSAVGGTPRLHHSPPIRGLLVQTLGRNVDGSEIDQKIGGKGGKVGHCADI
jgi:hypothetical protein